MTPDTPPPKKNKWSWRSQAFRGLIYQVLAIGLIVVAFLLLAMTGMGLLAVRNMRAINASTV